MDVLQIKNMGKELERFLGGLDVAAPVIGGETGSGNRGSRANQPPKEVVIRCLGGYHK